MAQVTEMAESTPTGFSDLTSTEGEDQRGGAPNRRLTWTTAAELRRSSRIRFEDGKIIEFLALPYDPGCHHAALRTAGRSNMRARHLMAAGALLITGVLVAPAVAGAAPTAAGTERFTLFFDVATEEDAPYPAVARGLLDGTGTGVTVNDVEDRLTLSNGEVSVFHSATEDNETFNERRCVFHVNETGVYVFGNGTGAWEGYNGSGTYTARGRIQLQFNADGSCNFEAPASGVITVRGSGPINAPFEEGQPPAEDEAPAEEPGV